MSKFEKLFKIHLRGPPILGASNHGHIPCKWYVLMFAQWLIFRRFSLLLFVYFRCCLRTLMPDITRNRFYIINLPLEKVFIHSVICWLFKKFVRSLVLLLFVQMCSIDRSFVHSFDRSVGHSFIRSSVLSFARMLLLSFLLSYFLKPSLTVTVVVLQVAK